MTYSIWNNMLNALVKFVDFIAEYDGYMYTISA